eukprot:4494252-Amphidinium_carterae.1
MWHQEIILLTIGGSTFTPSKSPTCKHSMHAWCSKSSLHNIACWVTKVLSQMVFWMSQARFHTRLKALALSGSQAKVMEVCLWCYKPSLVGLRVHQMISLSYHPHFSGDGWASDILLERR